MNSFAKAVDFYSKPSQLDYESWPSIFRRMQMIDLRCVGSTIWTVRAFACRSSRRDPRYNKDTTKYDSLLLWGLGSAYAGKWRTLFVLWMRRGNRQANVDGVLYVVRLTNERGSRNHDKFITEIINNGVTLIFVVWVIALRKLILREVF